MSFIFARKYSNGIEIFADNKMTIDSNDESIIINAVGMATYKRIMSLGVIKNVIVNESICICSAGILEDFNKLLEYIDNKESILLDDICNKALEINNKSNNRTDFIICSVKDNKIIIQIKDYEKCEVESSWIGSKKCFEVFQSIRHSEEISKQTIYDCETKKDIPLNDEGIDSFSFQNTLQSIVDSTVGEKAIICESVNNKFYYREGLSTSISKPRTVELGKVINLYDDVFDGGYTYYIYHSSDNYKMYIDQLKCGIVYCPFLTYEKYNHLRLPKLEYCTVEEFQDKNNCEECSMKMYV